MEALVAWLKSVFGWRWVIVLPIVLLSALGFQQYQSERSYHEWAGSFVAHKYSDVVYSNGYIRVKWEKLPKAPRTDIIIHYLFHRPGLPLIGTAQQFIPEKSSNEYRKSRQQTDVNLHLVPYWGSPVFVGDLQPGMYEVVVYYEYPKSWWYPDWTADQRIIFTVEDDNA